MKLVIVLSLSAVVFCGPHSVTSSHTYEDWYPGFKPQIVNWTRTTCAAQFNAYFNLPSPFPGSLNGKEKPYVDCLLGCFPESDKANMAAAAVLLGLLPTILALSGSSTMETGLLARRRPFLALLLAGGSPAVSPIRAFIYQDPAELLERLPKRIETLPLSPAKALVVCGLEYLLASGAVVNLVLVSVQLGTQTSCAKSLEVTFEPFLWAILAVAVHIGGALGVVLRLRLVKKADTSTPFSRTPLDLLRREFCLSGSNGETKLEYKEENFLYVAISWITSLGTVLHLVYGTLVFSSTLFINTGDTLFVCARYLASTVLCRMILMFEVSGMRDDIVEIEKAKEANNGDESSDQEALVVRGNHDGNDNDRGHFMQLPDYPRVPRRSTVLLP